jgi:hypothetical protein
MIPTYFKDNFLFFKKKNSPDSILGDPLVIESDKIDETINYVNKENIKSIQINSNYFKLTNLHFLETIKSIQGIYLLTENIGISAINALSNLQLLILNEAKEKIDLKNFPKLRVLSYSGKNNVQNINYCKNLFWLWVDGYKKEDLIEFKGLTKMEYLSLSHSSIRNIRGIEDMSELKYIRLDTMRKLESLKGVREDMRKLKVIDIYGAKNLSDYIEISKVKSLQQLELRQTGDAASISFIKDLVNLKKVTIGFKVLDGDMSYLKDIESVGFIDFPHYNIKMRDFLA